MHDAIPCSEVAIGGVATGESLTMSVIGDIYRERDLQAISYVELLSKCLIAIILNVCLLNCSFLNFLGSQGMGEAMHYLFYKKK